MVMFGVLSVDVVVGVSSSSSMSAVVSVGGSVLLLPSSSFYLHAFLPFFSLFLLLLFCVLFVLRFSLLCFISLSSVDVVSSGLNVRRPDKSFGRRAARGDESSTLFVVT